jgi:hypothetical protein
MRHTVMSAADRELAHLLVPFGPDKVHDPLDPLDRRGHHLLRELAVPHGLVHQLARNRPWAGVGAAGVAVVVERGGEGAGEPIEGDVGEDGVERGILVRPDEELFADPTPSVLASV